MVCIFHYMFKRKQCRCQSQCYSSKTINWGSSNFVLISLCYYFFFFFSMDRKWIIYFVYEIFIQRFSLHPICNLNISLNFLNPIFFQVRFFFHIVDFQYRFV